MNKRLTKLKKNKKIRFLILLKNVMKMKFL